MFWQCRPSFSLNKGGQGVFVFTLYEQVSLVSCSLEILFSSFHERHYLFY